MVIGDITDSHRIDISKWYKCSLEEAEREIKKEIDQTRSISRISFVDDIVESMIAKRFSLSGTMPAS